MNYLETIKEKLIAGKNKEVALLTSEALNKGLDPQEMLDKSLIAGMDIIGVRFRKYEIFLPQVLLAARAMYAGLDLLQPLLEGDKKNTKGKVVIGSVEGDLHDIGKNLVGIMMRGAGFEVIDLGNNVTPDKFVAAAKEHNADIVGMSALLTTTMSSMGKVIKALKEAGLDKVKTVIGGAPVSEEFAKEIGADAYGFDALRSVEIVKGFIQ